MTSTLGHLKHKTNIIWVSIINIDLSVDYLLILQVFIFSHFDWICCNRTQGVCVSVCVCVCVCVSVCLYVCVTSTAQTDEPILMKLSTNHLTDICQCHFSRFLKFRIWWRHGGHFAFLRCGTLTVAILVRFSSNLDTSFSNAWRCLLLKISKIGW